MSVMTRRGLLAGAVSLAGGRKRRRHMAMYADESGVFFQLVITGGGEFTYDASGNLRTANVGQTTTDPLQGITCYAGFSTFNGHGAVISLFSSTLDAQLWYADTGTSTQGALTNSVASAGATDPFGNLALVGNVTYGTVAGTLFAVQQAGRGFTFLTAPAAAGPWTNIASIIPLANGTVNVNAGNNLILNANGGSATVVAGPGPAATSAALEVQGDLQAGSGLSIGKSAAVQTLVNGSTISTAGITMQPITCAAAVTGIILQAGTFDGQVIAIPNTGNNTATFAAAATSHVAAGVGGVIQPADTKLLFWVASTSLWYQVA